MLKCFNCDSHIDSTQFGYCSKDCEFDKEYLHTPGMCNTCHGTGLDSGGYCEECNGRGCFDEIRDYD